MVVAFHRLYHAEVIHVTVAVEVERRKHVVRRVEQALKLLEGVGFSEGGSHGAKVEEEADIFVERGHLYHGSGGLGRRGLDHGSGL